MKQSTGTLVRFSGSHAMAATVVVTGGLGFSVLQGRLWTLMGAFEAQKW